MQPTRTIFFLLLSETYISEVPVTDSPWTNVVWQNVSGISNDKTTTVFQETMSIHETMLRAVGSKMVLSSCSHSDLHLVSRQPVANTQQAAGVRMRGQSAQCSQNRWWVPLCLSHWLSLWGSRCIQHFPPSGLFPLLPEGGRSINQTLYCTHFPLVTEGETRDIDIEKCCLLISWFSPVFCPTPRCCPFCWPHSQSYPKYHTGVYELQSLLQSLARGLFLQVVRNQGWASVVTQDTWRYQRILNVFLEFVISYAVDTEKCLVATHALSVLYSALNINLECTHQSWV